MNSYDTIVEFQL